MNTVARGRSRPLRLALAILVLGAFVAAAGYLQASWLIVGLVLTAWAAAFAVALVGRRGKEYPRRRIGVMGGAFDPIHTGHLLAAQSAFEQLRLDKVLFVPSGNPPHKGRELLEKEARYEMVAAAVADNINFEASRLEIDRPGVTWTIDTLRELRRQYGRRAELIFIIGEDNIAAMRDYPRRRELLSLCRLAVCPRLVPDAMKIADWRRALPEADLVVLDFAANGLSSTEIRQRVRSGRSIRWLVPDVVRRLIEERGHYQARGDGNEHR